MSTYPLIWVSGVSCNSVANGFGLHPNHPPRAVGSPTVQSASVPGRNGELWTPQGAYIAPLFVITLRVVGQGSTMDARYASVESIIQTWTRIARDPKVILKQQVAASGAGSVLYAEGRLYTAPVREREIQGNLEVEKLTLTFQIPSGFWSDTSPGTPSFTYSITAPTMGTRYVVDSVASTGPLLDAQIRITGPIVNPVYTDFKTGDWVRYNGSVGSGSQIRFDLANFNAFTSSSWSSGDWSSGGTDVSGQMYYGGNAQNYSPSMVRLQPGFTVVSGAASLTGIEGTLTGTGTSGSTKLEVRGRRAYA